MVVLKPSKFERQPSGELPINIRRRRELARTQVEKVRATQARKLAKAEIQRRFPKADYNLEFYEDGSLKKATAKPVEYKVTQDSEGKNKQFSKYIPREVEFSKEGFPTKDIKRDVSLKFVSRKDRREDREVYVKERTVWDQQGNPLIKEEYGKYERDNKKGTTTSTRILLDERTDFKEGIERDFRDRNESRELRIRERRLEEKRLEEEKKQIEQAIEKPEPSRKVKVVETIKIPTGTGSQAAQNVLALQFALENTQLSDKAREAVKKRLAEERAKITKTEKATRPLGGGRIVVSGTVPAIEVKEFKPVRVLDEEIGRPEISLPPELASGVRLGLEERDIQQTQRKTSEVTFETFDLEAPRVQLRTEVAAGVRERIETKQIQQTFSGGAQGVKIFPKADFPVLPHERAIAELGKLTIEPIKDIKEFTEKFTLGTIETGEELAALTKARTEKERENIRRRILNIGKEVFITPEALTTGAVLAFSYSPLKVKQLALRGFVGLTGVQFIESPSIETGVRFGFASTLLAIEKAPKIIRDVKLGIREARAAQQFKSVDRLPTFKFEKPALEPRSVSKFIDIRTGEEVLSFGDFQKVTPVKSLQLSFQPQSGRPIIVTQALLKRPPLLLTTDVKPLPPFVVVQKRFPTTQQQFLKGLGLKVSPRAIPKQTVIEFLKPPPKQTTLPEFLFQTKPKTVFFDIKDPGELQGIRFPIGKESKFIRFKGFKELPKPIKFKPPKDFQQPLGLFTGEIIPLKFVGPILKPSRAVPFAGIVKTPLKPKPIKISFTGGKQESVVILKKQDVFAGDVVFKPQRLETPLFGPEPTGQAADVIRPPPTRAPAIIFPPVGVLDDFTREDQKDFLKGKQRQDILQVPTVFTGVDIDIGTKFDTDIKVDIEGVTDQAQIAQPKSIVDTSIDISQKQPTVEKIAQDTTVEPIPIPITITETFRDFDIDIPQPEPPEEIEPTTPIDIDFDKKPKKVKKMAGYTALVKHKGKFIKINKKPLPRLKALNLGAKVTDNTTAATFKIIRKGNITPQLDDFSFGLKGKFRKKDGNYIEKNTFRIDSQGEFEGITVQGWLAQRKKRFGGFI